MAIENIIKSLDKFYYLEISIIIILLQTAFDQYLNYRQYKRIKCNKELPENLKFFNVEIEEFKKSKIYSKDKIEFTIKIELFKTFLDLVMLILFYYPYIWNLSSEILNFFAFHRFRIYKSTSYYINRNY